MHTDFPKSDNQFIKSSIFQDQEIPLTYKGWEKKPNKDVEIKGQARTWKQNLKFQLRYSYPEFAVDEAGEKLVGKDGQPIKNRYYDPEYPQGYSIIYHFDEGQLETGSLPLYRSFCMVQPKSGDTVIISKTGEGKETKWKVKKVSKDNVQAKASGEEYYDETPF